MKAQLKKVIVEVPEEETGLLKSTEQRKSVCAKVISKGPECECDIQEGDEVIISGFAGVPFEVEGKKYLVMQQEEILVKI